METKSRYEVIAELEGKKRDLIEERDNVDKEVIAREDKVRNLKRQKEDTITHIDRQIADAERDHTQFTEATDERKSTIGELIKSVDDSLARFSGLGEKK